MKSRLFALPNQTSHSFEDLIAPYHVDRICPPEVDVIYNQAKLDELHATSYRDTSDLPKTALRNHQAIITWVTENDIDEPVIAPDLYNGLYPYSLSWENRQGYFHHYQTDHNTTNDLGITGTITVQKLHDVLVKQHRETMEVIEDLDRELGAYLKHQERPDVLDYLAAHRKDPTYRRVLADANQQPFARGLANIIRQWGGNLSYVDPLGTLGLITASVPNTLDLYAQINTLAPHHWIDSVGRWVTSLTHHQHHLSHRQLQDRVFSDLELLTLQGRADDEVHIYEISL